MPNQIILARWIIPVYEHETTQTEMTVLKNHGMVIENGKIIAIKPHDELKGRYQDYETVELLNHVLIPGLINCHTHAAMNLFRGMADDLPLMEWLNNYIWPAEGRWIDEHFVKDGVEIAMGEMLLSGTTCFNDMYFFPNVVAKSALETQMRVCLSFPVLDFPSAWANSADEYIHKGLQLHDDFKNQSLIKVGFGPHGPYTVSDEPLRKIATLVEELDTFIHIHLHETQQEVDDSIANYGKRPIERLNELGLLSPRFHGVHMTALIESEIELFQQSGSHIIHCPESNLKLASGFCPVQKLLDYNINVGLGTDGAASNNDLDMLGEMKTAALIAKPIAQNASALPAKKALEMATINGAKAFGLEKQIGSLEVGKEADLIAINLNTIDTLPIYNPVSQVVYATNRDQVSDVWVAGNRLVKNRQLQTLDMDTLKSKATHWGEKIQGEPT